jgi:hypothetical protein
VTLSSPMYLRWAVLLQCLAACYAASPLLIANDLDIFVLS